MVIAAAYTAVDQAESERDLAHAVNAETPGAIAAALRRRAAPALVHVSTDYVFDGDKGAPYVEADAPARSTSMARPSWRASARSLAACPRAL